MSHWRWWMLVEFLVLANVAFAGAAVFYWAKPMAEWYSAWTMRFGERHPQMSKPPSPETISLNYKILVIFFRIAGAFLFGEAVYLFVHAIQRIPR